MVVAERPAEADTKRLVLDVEFFAVAHSLDDLRQRSFECGEVSHGLLKKAVGELPVVVAQVVNIDDETVSVLLEHFGDAIGVFGVVVG